jgi:hypothetical protein
MVLAHQATARAQSPAIRPATPTPLFETFEVFVRFVVTLFWLAWRR